jgi:hypothetical protein
VEEILKSRNSSFDSRKQTGHNKKMLMVQRFHSIHDIDPEFIPNIELLLQEEVVSFSTLIEKHDAAPEGHVFTYFLFFGPTQNTPIGFAQICLSPISSKKILPWFRKLKFWNKEHLHWKQSSWAIADGSSGLCLFDPKFSRSGKEKIQELIAEYASRSDIMAQEFYCLKGLQDFDFIWSNENKLSKESYILEPLTKAFKTYQDYISSLDSEIQNMIKSSWRDLHQKGQIQLGDYASVLDVPKILPLPQEQLEQWNKWGGQVLTFEKDLQILGCLLVLNGKNGNIVFEPFPFEPEGEVVVNDELYTQYALLKFFEMPHGRKCHLFKFGSKLTFDDKNDLKFFQSQGLQFKTVVHHFITRSKEITRSI